MIISLDKYKATGGGTKVEGDIAISENGIYDVTTYATANVYVQPSDNYSYFDGGVDVEGLRAIGWDDASIGMFRDNNPHYSWQNIDYIVSEENKALYGVIDSATKISNYKNDPNFVFCPVFQIGKTTSLSFQNCTNLCGIPKIDTNSSTYGLSSLDFKNCIKLSTIPLLDTSMLTLFRGMFYGCSSLTSIPQLNTSNATDMYQMFYGCSSLTIIPQLDTSKVTNMGQMFYGCSSLTSIPQLNTSNVTAMNNMFQDCSSLTSIPQLDTSNATDMGTMFQNCKSLISIPQLDTSKVRNMYSMFSQCISLTSIPQLDTSNVVTISNMFYGCSSLTSIPQIDTTNVTTAISTIFGYSSLNKLTYLGGFKNLSMSITSYFLDNCPNLTVESLMNVINNLATVSGKSLKFGSTNLNKLTAEQIAVATSKGWTLT